MGDGGYDRTGVYTALDERHPDAKVVVPPRADAVLSATADTEPTQRDRHIQAIAGKGRMAWQRDSGYNQRARVEGQFARWKQVIGDGLRFHSDQARATAPSRPRSSTECSTLDARTPSASHEQQRGMGAPLPLPPPCNTLARADAARKLAALPEDLGQPETLLADNGYFSAANVETCQAAGIVPLIALGREGHHPSLGERFTEAPPAPKNTTPVEAMVHRLKTLEGRKLYAQRKHIPEPVFGIIKSVLGFRPGATHEMGWRDLTV